MPSNKLMVPFLFKVFIWGVAFALTWAPASLLAAPSSLQAIISKGKAVVSVESIDAAVYGDKPQAVFDQATGRMLVVKKIHRVESIQKGTGIILSSQGIIVTSKHTLKKKHPVFVTLFNGTRLQAKVLHDVPNQDISFILIQPPFALETIRFANSDAIHTGMSVYAMGQSQWLAGSVTGGEIQALGIGEVSGATRITSLRINFKAYQGDSGAPILDGNGNLLGMIAAGQVVGKVTYAVTSNLIGTAFENYLRSLR